MKAVVLLTTVAMVLALSATALHAATEEEIQAAIDDGLAWLALQQNTTPGDDYGSFGDSRKVAKTGLAVKKFEHDAILRGYDSPFDGAYLYHEVVEIGLDYIFANAVSVPISGDADTDDDGIAIAFGYGYGGRTYETGIALMAIAESTTPERVVDVSGSEVDTWTYSAVALDVMNWLAYAQIDAGTDLGGWGYDGTAVWGDQSNSGYATLGLGFYAAPPPDGFGMDDLPDFVLDQLGDPGNWIDYIQNDVSVGDPQYDGGSGYSSPESVVNTLETGNLLFEMALYGDPPGTQRVQDAIGYLVRAWNLPAIPIGGDWWEYQGWIGNPAYAESVGNYQAMFTIMKGLEAYQIDQIGLIDWFDDLATYIVNNQHGNGSWGPDFWDVWAGGDAIPTTAWALLTLQKAAPTIVLDVAFDIKPTSCPNPLNTKTKGVLPAAILGEEEFDVTTVDPATLLLEGIPPVRWAYEDVATPVGDEAEPCECTTEGPDGYMDLTLKFDTPELVAVLLPVTNGEVRPLTLTGETFDGLAFETEDCVIFRHKANGVPTREPGATEGLASHSGVPITEVSLGRGSPNPFTSETRLLLALPEHADVRLVVYDVSGKKVKTLVDTELGAGHHAIHWDGRDSTGAPVASGVYFCRLEAGGVERATKLMLIR